MIKNRRYKYLIDKLIDSEYFEEEAIKMRHPLLHFIYLGRYQTEGS